jgi:hypothetical protein
MEELLVWNRQSFSGIYSRKDPDLQDYSVAKCNQFNISSK